MIISINQPAYLPWLGYFNRIVKSDLHVVLDHVQFEKNSFINRNKILINNEPLWLTIPVLTKGNFSNMSIKDLKINPHISWQKKHWMSIRQAYSKTINWDNIEIELSNIYKLETDSLADVLRTSLDFFIQYLNIATPVKYSSDYNFRKSKSDLVLEICQRFEATTYLSGPLGRNYLIEDDFKKENIQIIYDDYNHPNYSQISDNFIPYLSTLDLIVNCDKPVLGVITNV